MGGGGAAEPVEIAAAAGRVPATTAESDAEGEKPASSGGAVTAAPPVEPSSELLTMLQNRAVEVEALLRLELTSDEALQGAHERIKSALAFDDELTRLAESKSISKGKLFQAMLEALRKAGEEHAQLDNSGKHLEGLGNEEFGLSVAEWAILTQKADATRKLVRVKLADDNDLKTARRGLEECAEFFDGLAQVAAWRGTTLVDSFKALQPAE